MATLAALQKQIAQLTAEAERVKKTEAKAVIAKIRESIAEFELTPADLFGAAPKGRRAGQSAAAGNTAPKPVGRRSAGEPKYRDPATGATWTGVGRAPNWIAAAKDRTTYLIGAPASVAAEGAQEAKPRRAAKKASVTRSAAAPVKKAAAKKAGAKSAVAKKGAAKTAAATPPVAKKARGNAAAGAKKAKGTEAKSARKGATRKTADGAGAVEQSETAAVAA